MDHYRVVWSLIETAREKAGGDSHRHARLLEKILRLAPVDTLPAVHHFFRVHLAKLNHWNILGPATIVGCGQSDDGFKDFRGWIISQGSEFFERMLKEPDCLADVPSEDPIEEWYFEFDYIPATIYEEDTGKEIPIFTVEDEDVIKGKPWSGESELSSRFPRLWSRFKE